jgi:outer membrane lipoprotein-sorting protein
MKHLHYSALFLFFALPLFATAGDVSLDEFLARMDKAAPSFTGMSSKISQQKYTAVISDKTTESGTFVMRKAGKIVRAKIDFTKPDPKSVGFAGQKAEIYYPAMKTVQEYDLGKQKGMVEQFLMLGFGTTGKELQTNYSVKLVGPESVSGHKTVHMVLTPKSAAVKEQFTKFEIWMDESGEYAVQQQVYQPSGDYYLITYSDIKVNPALTETAVALSLPKGVKREKH